MGCLGLPSGLSTKGACALWPALVFVSLCTRSGLSLLTELLSHDLVSICHTALKHLRGRIAEAASFCFWAGTGLALNVFLIMRIAGYTSVLNAILFLLAYRALTSLSYIHINIFQHIGLPMYTLEDRPAKLYQMSTGVLNLYGNPILNWIMGHTLVFCHIEHHLFPSLSDNMALKVRPIVKQFLLDNGLPYHEKPYMERLSYFVDKYEELMVKAPPFTHYVGLQ